MPQSLPHDEPRRLDPEGRPSCAPMAPLTPRHSSPVQRWLDEQARRPRDPSPHPRESPSTFGEPIYLSLGTDGCQIAVNDNYIPKLSQASIYTAGTGCNCAEDGYGIAAIMMILYPLFANRAWGWSDTYAKHLVNEHSARYWGEIARVKIAERLKGHLDLDMVRAIQETLRSKAKELSGADGPRVLLWEIEDESNTKVRESERRKIEESVFQPLHWCFWKRAKSATDGQELN